MKVFVFAAGLTMLLACNSNNSETDTMNTTGVTTTEDTANTAASNPMMEMHNSMSGMMQQMKNLQPTGDPDYDFAMLMRHHHEGAVKMSQTEVNSGADATVKEKAQVIIDEQQKEILELDNYLSATSKPSGSADFGKKAMSMVSTDMNSMQMEGSSLDAMYVSMMIPHHEEGIKISQEYLKSAKDAKLKSLANKIIDSNKKEVKEFKAWMANNKK